MLPCAFARPKAVALKAKGLRQTNNLPHPRLGAQIAGQADDLLLEDWVVG